MISDQHIREFVGEMVRFLQPKQSVGVVVIGRAPDGLFCFIQHEFGKEQLMFGPEGVHEDVHNAVENLLQELRRGPGGGTNEFSLLSH